MTSADVATGTSTEQRDGDAGTDSGAPTERPLRADARRNRERLVAAARSVFAEQGADASMEAIAKAAGVGVGTLYRHFPTRLDVVEAAYRTNIDELVAAADEAVATLAPFDALAAFVSAFVRYAEGKRTMLTEIRRAFEKDPDLQGRLRLQIERAWAEVVDYAHEGGAIRADVTAADLRELMWSICANPEVGTDQARRLADVVVAGLRATGD
jgi:AcrR family transcriptional regulator